MNQNLLDTTASTLPRPLHERAGSASQKTWLRATVLLHALLTPFFFEFHNLPFRLTTTDLLAVLVLLLWLVGRVRRRPDDASLPLLLPTLVFVGAHFLAVLPAADRMVAVREAVKMAGIFAVFFAVADTIRMSDDRRLLAWALTLSTAVVSGLAIVEAFRGPAGWGYTNVRPAATMGNPNTVGAYLATLLPISLALLYQAIIERRHLYSILPVVLSLALMAVALALTLSRGAWISLAVALPIVAAVFPTRRRARSLLMGILISLAAVGAVAGAVMLLVPAGSGLDVVHTLVRRAMSIVEFGSGSDRVRWMVLRSAWAMFLDNPWLGVGPGNFQARLSTYVRPMGHDEELLVPLVLSLEFPHNLPLQVAAESGIIGLAALAVWGTSLMVHCARRLRAARCRGSELVPDHLLTVGGFAGVVATLIGALFGYPFVHHVWEPFVYAAALAVAEPPRRSDPSKTGNG